MRSRDDIINILKVGYLSKTKQNLAIFGVVSFFQINLDQQPKILKEFTTTKNDVKKGVSRVPLDLSRLRDEDTAMEIDGQG